MILALPYVITMIIFAIMAVIYAQRREREDDKILCSSILLVSIGLFYIFFAFRGYVYSDWESYYIIYENADWCDVLELTSTKQTAVIHEPGFTLLMCICKMFSSEYAFMVIVITTIDTLLLLRFLKRWDIDNLPLVFMLLIIFGGITVIFNLLRNQLSIFILLNALEYIEKKQPMKYYFLCILALCFHVSALLFLPLYFVLGRKINRWVFLGGCIVFFSLYILKIPIVLTLVKVLGLGGVFGEKAEVFTEVFKSERAFSLTGTIEKIGTVGLVTCYYNKLIEDKKNVIIINCLFIYYFFYFVFGEFETLSSRLSILFLFSYWVIWCKLINEMTHKNNKRIICSLLFLYGLYSQSLSYIYPVQEYDNLLFGGKSSVERQRILDKTYDHRVE